MKAVRIISLIARVALMTTMALGLLFWIAHIHGLGMLLNILVQIHFMSIHEGFGLIGALTLLVRGSVAISTRGIRPLGVGSMIYALLVPIFGLTQAMFLALRIEKRYRRLRKAASGEAFPRTTVFQATR